MGQYCKYHPKQAAAWSCESCETLFCSACVKEDKENYFPKCTLCRRSLKSLSVADRIPPFWQKLGSLLVMPLKPAPLALIVLFAATMAALPNNKIGAILFLLALLPLVELLFDSMEQVAAGDALEAKMGNYLTLKNKSFFIKLLVAYVFIVFVLAKIYTSYPELSLILGAFFIFGIPASLIILMMEKSMFSMLNPAKIAYIIKTFRGAYWLLYAFMLASMALAVYSGEFAAGSDFTFMQNFLMKVVVLYLVMCVFVMAGYLVYQYHHELNFTINRQSLYKVDATQGSDDFAEINIFIQEGRYEDAQRMLLERINQNPKDYRASEKLILLYAIQNKMPWMEKVANEYFETMVSNNKQKQAADFYLKLQQRGIHFVPDNCQVVTGLVSSMANKQQYKTALTLSEAYRSSHSKPSGWESLYLISARLYMEFANQPENAADLLKQIINRSINQDIMQEAEDYLTRVVSG